MEMSYSDSVFKAFLKDDSPPPGHSKNHDQNAYTKLHRSNSTVCASTASPNEHDMHDIDPMDFHQFDQQWASQDKGMTHITDSIQQLLSTINTDSSFLTTLANSNQQNIDYSDENNNANIIQLNSSSKNSRDFLKNNLSTTKSTSNDYGLNTLPYNSRSNVQNTAFQSKQNDLTIPSNNITSQSSQKGRASKTSSNTGLPPRARSYSTPAHCDPAHFQPYYPQSFSNNSSNMNTNQESYYPNEYAQDQYAQEYIPSDQYDYRRPQYMPYPVPMYYMHPGDASKRYYDKYPMYQQDPYYAPAMHSMPVNMPMPRHSYPQEMPYVPQEPHKGNVRTLLPKFPANTQRRQLPRNYML